MSAEIVGIQISALKSDVFDRYAVPDLAKQLTSFVHPPDIDELGRSDPGFILEQFSEMIDGVACFLHWYCYVIIRFCKMLIDFLNNIVNLLVHVLGIKTYSKNDLIPDWAKGRVKQRPGALISVGGALSESWTSLGLATLYTLRRI